MRIGRVSFYRAKIRVKDKYEWLDVLYDFAYNHGRCTRCVIADVEHKVHIHIEFADGHVISLTIEPVRA